MDLRLFLRVVRRFRFVAVIGFTLAGALALLSYVKVGPHGLTYRTPQVWSSTAKVFIASGDKTEVASGTSGAAVAPLYASLVSSDPVRQLAFSRHRVPGSVVASINFNNDTQSTLPILNVTGLSTTPRRAAILASDGVWALSTYLERQQKDLPLSERFRLDYVNLPSPLTAVVAAPRSKTRPIMVLVLGIAATLALILILENLRPRLREVPADAERAA